AGAWGQRWLPIIISIMFAMTFSMEVSQQLNEGSLLTTCLNFVSGSMCYVVYATAANALLNSRYRAQLLAQSMLALSRLMRIQADRFDPTPDTPQAAAVVQRQALLAEQLQAARDLLLESPRTARRQQRAAILINIVEIREHLLTSELD